MKKLVLFFIFVTFSSLSFAKEIYKIDSSHASVVWRADHFGFSKPSGKFSDVSGSIIIDRDNPQNDSVEVTIKTDSLTTGLSKFDHHLRGPDFFDEENFPTITFKSSAISPYTRSKAKIRGHLNILGVDKMVTLKVKLNKEGKNPINQKQTIGFSATAKIKRSDFGMNYALPGIADEVEIEIEIEAILIEKTQDNYSNNFMRKQSKTSSIPNWKIKPDHSKLEFVAYQNNSNIDGSFKEFDGEINFDRHDLSNSNIKIDIYTNSISMSFSDIVEVVKSTDWLNTQAFRKATFESTRIYQGSGADRFKADGFLTIKNNKIPVTLDFLLNEYGKTTARITGHTSINRTRFKVGPLSALKSKNVDNQVNLKFEISAERN